MSEVKRESGIVEKFDSKRGFGFIKSDAAKENIFVHFSNIQGNGYKELKPNQKVSFELAQNAKGLTALNVKGE